MVFQDGKRGRILKFFDLLLDYASAGQKKGPTFKGPPFKLGLRLSVTHEAGRRCLQLDE